MVQLGLVIAQYDKHGAVIDAMAQSARDAAEECDAEIAAALDVPGSYDTPLAADRLARRDDVDAVAVLGAIISGDTDHDQVIGAAAAQGLTDVSLDRDTPVTMGIIGPGMSQDEAEARTDKGGEAVRSAVALAEELKL
ncbi:6,7-dimethyl-8-ribityllumazine synthase [Halomicrobium zhouii]|uniref:6,7-dimethyl-8-ribityllumazine synthase n=1 Tax=Halomicrobium zhouii TaxID=767519 RepID=A0A1I6KSF6_9EURY|nr:6,7-dimethyl-8-ribityllumazine synthase [Halomicrobium zhouii]SFR94127.1 6,7-dimethyl-8-ribityllumazine synthase [Halomicrobium zhouii]